MARNIARQILGAAMYYRCEIENRCGKNTNTKNKISLALFV